MELCHRSLLHRASLSIGSDPLGGWNGTEGADQCVIVFVIIRNLNFKNVYLWALIN